MKFHDERVIEEIRSLDPSQQKISVKAKSFDRSSFKGQFDCLFADGESTKIISRCQVREEMVRDTRKGILLAFAWGFPSGGRGKQGENLINNLSKFCDLIERMNATGISEDNWDAINSFHGINFATTTKFLHFAEVASSAGQCQIFDARVRTFLEKLQPDEFSGTLPKICARRGYGLSYATYIGYLEELNFLASKLCVSGSAIEMYMFLHSPGYRRARHQ